MRSVLKHGCKVIIFYQIGLVRCPCAGAFLSGRYAPNTGFEGAGGGGGKAGGKVRVFPSEQPLLPAVLKGRG